MSTNNEASSSLAHSESRAPVGQRGCVCTICTRNRKFREALETGDTRTAKLAYDSLFEESASNEMDAAGYREALKNLYTALTDDDGSDADEARLQDAIHAAALLLSPMASPIDDTDGQF